MKSKRTKQFRALFAELPEPVQRQAKDFGHKHAPKFVLV